MKVTLYFINWNDSYYIPFIARHYYTFCHRIVMYDNHSTDNSVELAKANGFEVETFGTIGELNDKEYLNIKNNCWKNNQDDWVIVCDADEFLYHQTLRATLAICKLNQFSIIKTKGFNIFSENMPENDIFEVKTGVFDENYSKKVIFDPKKLTEIGYIYGCHVAKPAGYIRETTPFLTLFHYRNIGGPHKLAERHAIYRHRMAKINLKLGLGVHYLQSDEERTAHWVKTYAESKEFQF